MNEEKNKLKKATTITSDDLAYILDDSCDGYTWDEFYRMRKAELARGSYSCPNASYIALELLTSRLLNMPWQSQRTTSETYKDFLQEAYLVISAHIKDYDEKLSNFPTYMSKWFTGLAREMRDDGMTDYQKTKKGYKVYSADALVCRSNGGDDEGTETPLEFEDESRNIDDIMEAKEKKRTNELLHQAIISTKEDEEEDLINEEDEKKKKDTYANIACAQLFLGGIASMSDYHKDILEEKLARKMQEKEGL